MSASEGTPRVALLARAGEACERIGSALREAGAEVVLVADPLQADPAEVRGAAPEAILVALDAAIEDAIERYGDVLADPGYMVIFEEAEQVALRTGWDAARWLRHLSAKLHRHDDVLPAGVEREEDLHPDPGPLQSPPRRIDLDEAIVAVTGEAQQRAGDVPSDSGLEGLLGLAGAVVDAPAAIEEAKFDAEPTADSAEAEPEAAADGSLEIEEVTFDSGDDLPDGFTIEAASDVDAATQDDDATDDALAGAVFESISEGDAADAMALDELAFNPERFSRAAQGDAEPEGIEAFLAARTAPSAAPEAGASAGDAGTAPQADADAHVAAPDFSGLSLVEDESAATVDRGTATKPAFDLDALGSGLSLADPDSYGHGKLPGAVVIEAGIGGPDAVRQLLAGIPEGFPKAILIHLPLDGGRYDRLVKQMVRATPLPVAVAEAGGRVERGNIYFVPPGLGLKAVAADWTFEDAVPFDPSELPADDSAVLFLSGADAALVPGLTGAGWHGGLVFGQTPDEGCYDPAAAQAAIAAGAGHGTPAALAARLLERWPAPGAGPEPDPDGMLSP